MASVSLRNVHKNFGPVTVLKSIDLDIADGEFVVLVGPSGCGKSTLLRSIAGLETINGGDILIGERQVNHVAPKDRDIAMVFQSYALYPHMDVRKNMAFSLNLRKSPAAFVAERVGVASQKLGLGNLLERLPKQLSGGQRQRVAIGRAIVRKPKVFLFDEPLSNLDAALRVQTRVEIAKLHRELGSASMVYVTHDQVEAMTMADRIVVMHDGRIEQIGTPLDLYDRPDNLFVAQFIGSPAMNIVNGRLRRGSGAAFVEADGGLRWPLGSTAGADGQAVAYGVRPEHLSLAEGNGADAVPAEITVVEPTGAETELLVQAGESQIVLVTHGRPQVNPGDKIGLRVDPAMVHVFDQATGQRLSA